MANQKEVDTQTDWKTRFEKDWYDEKMNGSEYNGWNGPTSDPSCEEVIKYVQELLTQQRNELINAFEGAVGEEVEIHDLENASWDEMRLQASVIGRNKLRQELRSKLDEMRKQ